MRFTTRRALWWGLRRIVAPLATFVLLVTQLVLPSPAEAATVSYRSAATAVSTGEGVLEIDTPEGVEPGDLLIAQIVATDPGATITAPTGWNLIRIDRDTDGGLLQGAYRRTATADEPAAHAWADTTTNLMAGGIAAYSGTDPTNPRLRPDHRTIPQCPQE
jgi:hypothetical protein